ncbi:MAG TPA: DUF4440 domain-containing protein [Candidatus Xenobia bacterium]|nr:DUF4440 domain-containing protein [Candidatus Xenobia bacterium]
MKRTLVCAFLAAILLTGCRVDIEAERAALRAADQAWSQTPPNVDRFMEFVADNAYTLVPDADILQGKAQIRNLWSGLFTTPGFALKWTATNVEVAADGRTGYTLGTWEMTMQDSGGKTLARTGKYITLWQKQSDGQWKVVADTAVFDSPPAEPSK